MSTGDDAGRPATPAVPGPDAVEDFLRQALPGFTPTGRPEPVAGGHLNLVWRVPAEPHGIVVKHAPPHVASAPSISLDPARIGFEARALERLTTGSLAPPDAASDLRVPRPLAFEPASSLLAMADLGTLPDLASALRSGQADSVAGGRLGTALAWLHGASVDDAHLAAEFDNRAMQRTRAEVQYRRVEDFARAAGLEDAGRLGRTAAALGDRLCRPGRCLVMGDLWPRSILVAGDGPRLIDWELCHYGQPAQDLGHLGAHLWMLRHMARSAAEAARIGDCWRAFAESYRARLERLAPGLMDPETARDSRLHAGAEILARLAGPFADGYVYADLALSDAWAREASGMAARLLRGELADWFRVVTEPTN